MTIYVTCEKCDAPVPVQDGTESGAWMRGSAPSARNGDLIGC
jgi:hypothetical protein